MDPLDENVSTTPLESGNGKRFGIFRPSPCSAKTTTAAMAISTAEKAQIVLIFMTVSFQKRGLCFDILGGRPYLGKRDSEGELAEKRSRRGLKKV